MSAATPKRLLNKHTRAISALFGVDDDGQGRKDDQGRADPQRDPLEQTHSAIRRHHSQRATLIGLKLNKIGRVTELQDTPAVRGMIAKVQHLVRVVDEK